MEAEPIGFLFLATILNWVTIKIQSYFLVCHEQEADNLAICNREEQLRLNAEEVVLVMTRIGFACNGEEGEMGCDDLSAIFDEYEPSFEEVRGAFSVFDENCDGFIDAGELHRVLLRLGFSEGVVGLEECEGMIRAHDVNRDGVMDLNEFVRFMEGSLC